MLISLFKSRTKSNKTQNRVYFPSDPFTHQTFTY